MILVDASVWVDHLRLSDARLVALLEGAAVVMHPFIVGEVACGGLAAAALNHGCALWTRDLRLRKMALALGCAHDESVAH